MLEVRSEVAVHPSNGAREFLLVDKDGYSMVLYGGQLQMMKFDFLQYFRIMMVVKKERK